MNNSATPPAPRRVRAERGVELLNEQRAAAETRESIVRRVVLEALLEAMTLGDILQ